MFKRLLDLLKPKASSISPVQQAGEDAFMLRSMDVAGRFPPMLSPTQVPGIDVTDKHLCKRCGATCNHVVITTWGHASSQDLWRAHPVALDGHSCPSCQDVLWPARLPPAVASELNGAAVLAAQAGDLDRADFLFRRLVNSYPDSATYRANLGSVYLDKRRVAQQQGGPADDVHLYGDRAREIFLSALDCPGPIDPRVPLTLARIHFFHNEHAEAQRLAERVLAGQDTPPAALAEAESLLDKIRSAANAGA